MEKVKDKSRDALIVMGGAHTLAITDGLVIGDPLEKQAFEGIKFRQAADGTRVSSGPGMQITQIKKYMFNSALKRMSVLAQISENNGTSYRILSKGAPEVLKKYMKTLPADYDETYLKFVKNGSRVLAMAYKSIDRMSNEQFNAYTREEAESDLTFCGFIVAECPLKDDTKAIMQELKDSSHEIKMITGDNALTAAFIGQELSFGNGKSIFAVSCPAPDQLIWNDLDDQQVSVTRSADDIVKLAKTYMLCINGDVLDKVILFQ